MADCLFCKINAHEIPADIVYEDDDVVVFHDISPEAPVHVLIVPRKHIENVNDVSAGDQGILGKLFLTARKIAEEMDVRHSGYRLVVNCGRDAGQAVDHLQVHLLGGREMEWPPG